MSLYTSPRLYSGNIDLSTFYTKEEVDCLSKYGRGDFRHGDRSLLKYYKPPATDSVSFDLMKDYTPLNASDDAAKGQFTALKRSNTERNAEFLCGRGLLTEISILPYGTQNSFRMSVVRHQGTFFLLNEIEKPELPGKAEMMFVGHKFAQYVTEDQDGVSNTDAPIDLDKGFFSIVEANLAGKHSLLVTNNVTCVTRDGNRYVELRTVPLARVETLNFYHFKIMKEWAQAYFVGAEKILCGLRNEENIVTEVREFQVAELPQLASRELKKLQPSWSPWEASVRLKFLSAFLDFIKENVTQDESVCLLNQELKGPVRIERLEKGDDRYESRMGRVMTE